MDAFGGLRMPRNARQYDARGDQRFMLWSALSLSMGGRWSTIPLAISDRGLGLAAHSMLHSVSQYEWTRVAISA